MKRNLQIVAIAALVGALSAGVVQTLFSARADQSERVVPTAGIYTGPAYAAKIGDMARSISTGNKGSSAPANVGGVVVDGLEWIDDTASTWIKKRYVNGGWAPEAAYDSTSSTYVGFLGGGLGTIASASTTDLGTVQQANISITSTTTIASFGSSAPSGAIKIVRFAAVLTLTYSSALAVPCGYDLVTAANDRAIVTHLGSGNWEFTSYTRANGIPVDCAAVADLKFNMSGAVPANWVSAYGQALTRTSYPAYLAKVTRAQNGTRTSGNATIASVANTDGFGVGMPVESTGVNAGCTIASFVVNTSVTLNSAGCVTGSGTSTLTVFLTGYGTGGSASTVGVPDCRGRGLAGRDNNIPGSYAATLSTTYAGTNGRAFNTLFGSESQTLTLAQLPTGITAANAAQAISVRSTTNAITHDIDEGSNVTSGGISKFGFTAAFARTQLTSTDTNSIAVTSNNTSGNPHPITQPALIGDCWARVTP